MMSHYVVIINTIFIFNMERYPQYFAGVGYRNMYSITHFYLKIYIYACKKNSRIDTNINGVISRTQNYKRSLLFSICFLAFGGFPPPPPLSIFFF